MPSIEAHGEPTRTTSRGARWIITLVAIFGGIAPWFADYDETHIFNPSWPPHAVFHDGQVLVFASASNLLALVFLLRRRADAWTSFLAAMSLVSLYWLSLSLAPLFPRAAWLDPEQARDPSQYILGIPGNAFGCIVVDTMLVLAAILGWRAASYRRSSASPHSVTPFSPSSR